MKDIFKNKEGFSLMEVTAVLFIVSIGLLGIMSLINQNIQVQNINKNNLIGHQLAQESLEVIRNVRDTNWKEGNDFDLNLDEGNYAIDFLTTTPASFSGLIADNFNIITLQMPTSGDYANMYLHNQMYSDTPFRRYVTITHPDDHTLNVIATVSWEDQNQTKTYVVETMLYDWQ